MRDHVQQARCACTRCLDARGVWKTPKIHNRNTNRTPIIYTSSPTYVAVLPEVHSQQGSQLVLGRQRVLVGGGADGKRARGGVLAQPHPSRALHAGSSALECGLESLEGAPGVVDGLGQRSADWLKRLRGLWRAHRSSLFKCWHSTDGRSQHPGKHLDH